eukprot:scaffold366_cov64-Cyclotella_meneghiniana.AAC.1
MNTPKTKETKAVDGQELRPDKVSSGDELNSNLKLKSGIGHEEINQTELDQKLRSSLSLTSSEDSLEGSQPTAAALVAPVLQTINNGAQADLVNFSSLKNLDEEKIKKTSILMYQANMNYERDTLNNLQRVPIDLTKMCTTNTETRECKTHTREQLYDILTKPAPKPNVIKDPASQFINNFLG